jgi:glyoxylase-like metal-dependent hydrolase (beta-lactamase superfamily II)
MVTHGEEPWTQALPEAGAVLVDPEGFGAPRYCGVYVIPEPEAGAGAALVETAGSPTADRVLAGLTAAGVNREDVRYVFVTHVHMDHAGAAWKLLPDLPNAKLVVHEKGAPYLTDAEKVGKLVASVERAVGPRFPLYGTLQPVDASRVIPVKGGESFTVAGREFHVVDAPGHAPHHYVLHDAAKRVVYTGDAVGMRPPGKPLLVTTPPPRFDLTAWARTLDAIDALDCKWALLTHFGAVDAREQTAAYRELLHKWVNEIRACREEGLTEAETVDRMITAHPEARDVYDEEGVREEAEMNVRGVWLWLDRGSA